MATLTAAELLAGQRDAERGMVKDALAINYTKAQINAVLQEIEDRMITTAIPALALGATVQAYLSARIDAVTAPLVLTNAQKKKLFAVWCKRRFEGDG